MRAGSFPIEAVISAAQRKAALEQQGDAQNNQQIVQGLEAIGKVGQSLVDKRLQVAQALALGKALNIPDDQSRQMTPEQVIHAGTIKSGAGSPLYYLMGLHPELAKNPAFMAAMSGNQPPTAGVNTGGTTPLATSPNGAMLASNVTATPIAPVAGVGGALPTATPAPVPVPIAAPGSVTPTADPMSTFLNMPMTKGQMASLKMGTAAAAANRPEHVMTQQQALDAGIVPKETRILPNAKDPNQFTIGGKEDQFYQREWDKLLKETDPLNASSRTPLGMASRATFNANRALKTLLNPVVTNQEAGNVMADVAGIYQNGSPTQFGMSHQAYDSLYGKIQGVKQLITGKPTDALPKDIKDRLVNVLSDMKATNQALLTQRLDMTEHTKKAVISRFPEEWKEYRAILEGDQSGYNGLTAGQSTAPATQGATPAWTNDHEQRLQMLLEKQRNGSLKS